MLKIKLFTIVFIMVGFGLKAEVKKYMVFLVDKDSTSFSIDSPEAFLTSRAISRREKQGITITAEDFPVNSQYVQSINATGAEVYFKSKWFNAVLVQMEETLVSTVQALDFVTKVEFIGEGNLLTRNKQEVEIPEEFMEPPLVLSNSNTQNQMIGAHSMHEDGFKGQNMLIAVFDNGFKGVNEFKPFQHIFDEDRIAGTRDFVGNTGNVFQYMTHGTKVLSCIGANYEDKLIGTAPEASFILCVTEALNEYRIEEYNWLLAAEYADSLGVDVINNSLGYSYGFTDTNMDYSLDDLDGQTTVITRAANIAARKGIIISTSAGNEGNGNNPLNWDKITPPADAFDVLVVGAVHSNGDRSSFSSYGPTTDGRISPDVTALGSGVAVMTGSGSIGKDSGTSFSSPIMAGFAACIWQMNPEWDYLEVMEAIKLSGSNVLAPDTIVGYGTPSYSTLINGGVLSLSQLLNTDLKVYPNPFKENIITIDLTQTIVNSPINLRIVDSNGKDVFIERITKRNTPDQIQVEFDAQAKGVYYLYLQSRKLEKSIKLLKI